MFFDGALQQGISKAVDQQKLVLCFVTDENDESLQWETEFLQDESIRDTIEAQAIALKLKAGSDEAGYLSQIFPLPKTPTVVIMKHGELKEYIAAGTSKDDFLRRISNAFSVSSSTSAAAGSPTTATSPQAAAPAASQSTSPPTGISPESDRSETVARVLAERAARAKKEEAERKAKAAEVASAKAKGKGRADPDANLGDSSAGAQEQAEIIKKKKLRASEERQRIMQRIENDKEARRLQAAERERRRQDGSAEQAAPSATVPLKPKTSDHSNAAIQVRLLDGSSIRSRFKASAPFKDVRKWVDQERTDEKQPYNFKQLLTPLPNKTIDSTEEAKSIGDLGLAPSATLLLIPAAAKFAVAYDDSASGGFLSHIVRMITGFFVWLLSLVGLGGQRPASETSPQEASASASTPAATAAKARRTRGPSDWKRDQQLYNGNSLNFEPRPDEDEK